MKNRYWTITKLYVIIDLSIERLQKLMKGFDMMNLNNILDKIYIIDSFSGINISDFGECQMVILGKINPNYIDEFCLLFKGVAFENEDFIQHYFDNQLGYSLVIDDSDIVAIIVAYHNVSNIDCMSQIILGAMAFANDYKFVR